MNHKLWYINDRLRKLNSNIMHLITQDLSQFCFGLLLLLGSEPIDTHYNSSSVHVEVWWSSGYSITCNISDV